MATIADRGAPDLLREAMRTCSGPFVSAGAFSMVVNVLMLTTSLYMMQVFDRVLAARSTDTLLFLTLIALGALAVMALLEIARGRILARSASWIEQSVGTEAFARAIEAQLRGRAYRGEALRDLATWRGWLASPGMIALYDLPWVPIYLGVVFLLHPSLGWIATAGAAVLFLLTLANEWTTAGLLRQANVVAMTSQRRADSVIRNAEVIDSMGMMGVVVRRWQEGLSSVHFAHGRAADRTGVVMEATLVGLAVLAVFVGGFGAWSALAPLAEAAMGLGVIKAEGNRRTVQHLEGGIVRAILVRDGDRVRAGQVLLRLDDVQTGAQREALEAQRHALIAQDARLVAELAQARAITWPAELLARRDEPRIADLIAGQTALFVSRSSAFANSQAVLAARAEQHRATLASAQGQLASQERQAVLIRDELKGVEELFRLGLERRPRLLALQRAEAALTGNREDLLGQIARAEAGLAETTAQMRAEADARLAEAGREQRDVRARLIDLEERLNQARDIAARRDIIAPEDGVVLNLRHFTLGGVVRPGEPVLDLVPAEDRLIAEVLVQPSDIDVVRPGLEAELRLTAFKQRLAPSLRGRVEFVAADAVYDERLRANVYRAHAALDDAELAKLGGAALTPGMPVEAMILVGERTFWQYITQPLLDSFARAFREQ